MDERPIDLTLTTPRGSKVSLPGLSPAQADAVEAALRSDTSAVVEAAKGDPCDSCGGKGGWTEKVETKTKGGGTVVTDKWVNCRPCNGTGVKKY